ncbi:hypothetical protein BGI10_01445 [Snodgrassella alvi]|uniref:BPSL0067 family protein n=1 Tax=Snodgrassella alvi TaxID=1196083 RepID=UPI0009FE756A|nr:BPSL0067 family protein [Snodgrassella alvi]ORF24967.1 hypothetical protein BGI07_06900 [Snodgrassella alvi]ORF33357.1 hypothetical protein BGI10_01445 [Snodgrassella alvi]ORF35498.1 hypothetical protein BGI11_01095 [Snodgrassella alvi]
MEFGLENHLHECVAVVKYFAKALHVCFWKKAPGLNEIINIQYVTAIAAFNNNGKFYDHTAIYISRTAAAINVYDQWNSVPLHFRSIQFKGHGYVSNDGDQFYVIE